MFQVYILGFWTPNPELLWVHRYMKSSRDDAPYLPSNVDFVAANNGLSGAEDVRRVLMEASYMVLGLGGEP